LRITAWRIFKRKHRASTFTGEGARRFGGRWNSKGVAVIYTSESVSLAVLEILVHLETPQLLDAYLLAPVRFEANLVKAVPVAKLPANWKKEPGPVALQTMGDDWVASGASAVLRVPSVIVPSEFNYLLNPGHRDFRRCAWGKPRPFKFDPRLAKGD
jgi:RES domain-containing protein